MEEKEIVLGVVHLNAYKVKDKQKAPTPVIELLAYDDASDGEYVVLEVVRSST